MAFGRNRSLRHLGRIEGTGTLIVPGEEDGEGEVSLGEVAYEVDGYRDGNSTRANGSLEGERAVLGAAHGVKGARVLREDGTHLDVTVSEPESDGPDDEGFAEIMVTGGFPVPE